MHITDTLYIVTCVSNPLLWKSRIQLAEKAIKSWLLEPNVHVTLVECTYGNRPPELEHLKKDHRVTYIQVKARTLLWIKENLMNIGINRLPHDANYIVTIDADIIYRKKGWAMDIINELNIYPIVQPWYSALDLGPNDEIIAAHRSFSSLFFDGKPVVPRFDEKMRLTNSPYQYGHPGYVWAWTRPFLNWTGGLFEYGGIGSGDHNMALALINHAHMSLPKTVNNNYRNLLYSWQNLAQSFNGVKLGHTNHTIEHFFHGNKSARAYNTRWQMFVEHEFDPITDVKRNSFGVLEFAGNKQKLEHVWHKYMKSRSEDSNILEQ
jgi:hypothetical protein